MLKESVPTLVLLLSAAAVNAKPFPSWVPGEADVICAKFDYFYHDHFVKYSGLILNRTESYRYDARRERLQGIKQIVLILSPKMLSQNLVNLANI